MPAPNLLTALARRSAPVDPSAAATPRRALPFGRCRAALASLALLLLALLAPTGPARAQQFVESNFMNGFDLPVGFVCHGTDLMFVYERGGRVFVIDRGVRQTQPMLDIREEVGGWRDFGMLGMALDPNFATNGWFYVSYVVDRHHLLHFGTPAYSATTDEYFAASITRVTRFTADRTTGFHSVVPGSRHVLLGTGPGDGSAITYESHGSGQLLFGRDGTLLVGLGDGAHYIIHGDFGSDPQTYYQQAIADGILRPEEDVGAFRAQMLDCLNGKILRLDPATGDGVPSNPFYDPARPRAARSRVYALGFRNPCRMTLRPGTGSTDPSLGRPGVLYVGDVGWYIREELDIVTQPGQNFGWPLFEGIEASPVYWPQVTENRDVPNPLGGTGGCGTYLRFQDLIQQAHDGHTTFFPNPCDPLTGIPATTPTFVHAMPVLDWRRTIDDVRVPKFENGVVVPRLLGSPESGIPGPQFHGSCSMAGVWHSGISFPTSYGPSYYHADFNDGWIRRLEFDAQDQLLAVHDLTTTTYPLFVGENPADHSLMYVAYNPQQMRSLRFGIEPPPKAVATADVQWSAGALDVQLDARASTDPQDQPLSYLWDLGNGRTSAAPQLAHHIRAGTTAGLHDLQLTVTDSMGASDTATLRLATRNTPPQVRITSFDNGALFSTAGPTTLPLQASVVDAEHGPQDLTYEWRVALHHNAHVHPEPVDTSPVTQAVLSPTPPFPELFAYSVELCVTDAGGLSTTVRQWLFPDHAGGSTSVLLTTPASGDRYEPGAAVGFSALTTGAVQRVEYYVGGELIGVATQPPYAFQWNPTGTGPMTAVALAIGTDGTGSNSHGIAFEVAAPTVSKIRIAQPGGDALEDLNPGPNAQLTDPVLTLGDNGSQWLTGLVFDAPQVPHRARLRSACIEFTAAGADSDKAHFELRVDPNPAPQPVRRQPKDLLARREGPAVNWSPMGWLGNESGAEQRTPDLVSLLQPLIDHHKWNHRLVALLDGTGLRRAWAVDGDASRAPLLTLEWLPPPPEQTVSQVYADGTEVTATGAVDTLGNTLVLGADQGSPHLTAVQFVLDLPPGAALKSARVQFTAASAAAGQAALSIRIEDADDAPPLATSPFDLSLRSSSQTAVPWFPPPWTAIGERADAERTPELAPLLQEVLDRTAWQPGGRILLLVEGTGSRTATAQDAGTTDAPVLELSYDLP